MKGTQQREIHVIGGGLAGSEAAWQIARMGLPVVLHEMRPTRGTEAHLTDGLAELVCSNSFRSDDAERNAVGLLHAEMRRLGSLIMRTGDRHAVPAKDRGFRWIVDGHRGESVAGHGTAVTAGQALIQLQSIPLKGERAVQKARLQELSSRLDAARGVSTAGRPVSAGANVATVVAIAIAVRR